MMSKHGVKNVGRSDLQMLNRKEKYWRSMELIWKLQEDDFVVDCLDLLCEDILDKFGIVSEHTMTVEYPSGKIVEISKFYTIFSWKKELLERWSS